MPDIHILKLIMQTFTVEQFQENFDELMDRVESGESFMITSEYGNAVMIPYKDVQEFINVNDEVIRIHIDHEEGS
jgi:PHD/YefM family antitoxin component YafN of YafNO toxin-antitoxin module